MCVGVATVYVCVCLSAEGGISRGGRLGAARPADVSASAAVPRAV